MTLDIAGRTLRQVLRQQLLQGSDQQQRGQGKAAGEMALFQVAQSGHHACVHGWREG